MYFLGEYRSERRALQINLKIDEMKYRSSMDRCPVGGLTMMTSFLAAFTMTSSFGPKSRTSTGWSNMALVSCSFLLHSISLWCLTWRTSMWSSHVSLMFATTRTHNNDERQSGVCTTKSTNSKASLHLRVLRGPHFFFPSLPKRFLWWFSAYDSTAYSAACLAEIYPPTLPSFSGLLLHRGTKTFTLGPSKNAFFPHSHSDWFRMNV